eukprot:TRINITY_DN5968_c0_g1_i2.p1 TRINITY_DN5968_c0_g1~~TRINITY_DN5968_c0_g1_i2.p1  ORF type:complete len:186 (+),score=47.05 TRINITY_DN5968_c0_g1_i2:346-903(+)
MFKEFQGDFSGAEDIYNKLLQEDPSDALTMKRRICIWKAQKKTRHRAVEELNDYLKIFMADVPAWQELGDLYLDEQQYKFAAYCYEELILAEPLNYHFHLKYAEILFTLGDFKTAKKYYAHTLELNPGNVRALYGFCLTCKSSGRAKGKDEAFNWGSEKLKSKYKAEAGQGVASSTERVLENLQN